MRYYCSDFRRIADYMEGGFVLDGSVSLAISVRALARDERGDALDNGDAPDAAAWDLRAHLDRHIKSPEERLGVMA